MPNPGVLMIDPRTPVIVGASWINVRTGDAEPIEMMTEASSQALADSGGSLATRVQSVRVVKGVWRYLDPGRIVAERLGVTQAQTMLTPYGGNEVYDLVARTADDIARGDLDVAIVCAAEFGKTRRSASKAGVKPRQVDELPDAVPDLLTGPEKPMSTDAENAVGAMVPLHFYAMAETALRHRRGETIDGHRQRVSELQAQAAAVAAHNPHAWLRGGPTADEINQVTAANRMVASPYSKLMTSNIDVDQGSAVVMCSVAAAIDAGVPTDQWVFPYSAAGAAEHWYISQRWAIDEAPAMRIAAETCLDLASMSIDDIDLIDLYSCFPVAVQVAQAGLGLDPARPFTITGGLTFSGGPLNCYCLQALVRAVELLRERRTTAFVTGNGGSFTKHSCLTLGTAEPVGPYRSARPQSLVDALPRRGPTDADSAHGTVEAYTAVFGRDQPEWAIVSVIDDAGARWFASTAEPARVHALLDSDQVGSRVSVRRHTDDAGATVEW